jgi:lysozyme
MSDPALPLAVSLIEGFEGFRSTPYRDAGRGIWTIGFGFTYLPDGSPVTADTPPISRSDADARLSVGAARTLAMVRAMAHVPITDNQGAALTSFAWNEGTGALRTSTLLALLNQGEPAEAAKQFGAWVYAGGKMLSDLVERRAAEAAVFLRPDDGVAPVDESDHS